MNDVPFRVWSDRFELKVVYSFPTDYGLRTDELYPVLCFLHGDKECEHRLDKGKAIKQAMRVHGPLGERSAQLERNKFIVVCPQLKYPGGDIWKNYRGTVVQVIKEMHEKELGDPNETYLTGFSYGGNGVFDIAMDGDFHWKALWAVDPPDPPMAKPAYPTWLSAGPYARGSKDRLEGLGFQKRETGLGSNYIYDDYGLEHGDTSIEAYADKDVYQWLRRPAQPTH